MFIYSLRVMAERCKLERGFACRRMLIAPRVSFGQGLGWGGGALGRCHCTRLVVGQVSLHEVRGCDSGGGSVVLAGCFCVLAGPHRSPYVTASIEVHILRRALTRFVAYAFAQHASQESTRILLMI